MEKIFITVVVLYALFVAIYFLWLKAGKRRKKNIIGQGSSIQEAGSLKTDIVGKSAFDINRLKPLAAKPTPLAATSPKSENLQKNHDTFASPNEVKPSAEVPQDELDETFSDSPPDDETELTYIDYPVEDETGEENEYEPEDDNEDEEEENDDEMESVVHSSLASGVQFEDLKNVVRTVNRTDEATSEQKQKAGDTLLEIRQTDMFEKVVSGKPDAKKIVTDLMAESLADFHRRKDEEAGNTGSGKKAPDNFNIKDFA